MESLAAAASRDIVMRALLSLKPIVPLPVTAQLQMGIGALPPAGLRATAGLVKAVPLPSDGHAILHPNAAVREDTFALNPEEAAHAKAVPAPYVLRPIPAHAMENNPARMPVVHGAPMQPIPPILIAPAAVAVKLQLTAGIIHAIAVKPFKAVPWIAPIKIVNARLRITGFANPHPVAKAQERIGVWDMEDLAAA